MNTKVILFITCFLPSVVLSNDVLYNRLSKLYGKNQEKCLVTAERYTRFFPENAAGYYYASKVYYNKSKNAHSARVEYSLLKKVISYAHRFERLDVSQQGSYIGWDVLKNEIKESVIVLSDKLSRDNQQSLSASLVISFSKLTDADIADIMIQSKKEIEINSGSSGAMHSGMPLGSELIPSANKESELELLKFINDERIKRGMQPLIWEEKLANASRYHAYDLATENYFNHATYDRRNDKLVRVGGTFDRIRKFTMSHL